jgi:hypothetical protein
MRFRPLLWSTMASATFRLCARLCVRSTRAIAAATSVKVWRQPSLPRAELIAVVGVSCIDRHGKTKYPEWLAQKPRTHDQICFAGRLAESTGKEVLCRALSFLTSFVLADQRVFCGVSAYGGDGCASWNGAPLAFSRALLTSAAFGPLPHLRVWNHGGLARQMAGQGIQERVILASGCPSLDKQASSCSSASVRPRYPSEVGNEVFLLEG